MASLSAASGTTDDKARCGEDQLPEYKTPEPDADGMVHLEMPEPDPDGIVRRVPGETKAAGVGYTGAMRRIDAALRSSGDPYDQAVADALNIGGLQSLQAQQAAVVQDAETSHDGRIESLAFSVCGAMAPWQPIGQRPIPAAPVCARLNARDWARDDPGNGVPWLYALQQADQAGDHAAQREALQRLASATRFDTRFGAAPAVVARVRAPSDADLAAQSSLAMQAIPLDLGAPFTVLTSRCRSKAGGDSQMAAACDAIAGRMIDHADSFLTRAVGGSIHKQVTGDGTRLDDIHQETSAYGQLWSAQVDEAPCSGERQMLRRMVQIGEHGEVALMREELKAQKPRLTRASR